MEADHPAFREVEAEVRGRVESLLAVGGRRSVDSFHRELGEICWKYCGMARSAEGLREALRRIPALRAQYWADVRVPGDNEELNQALEKAGRVADLLELAELMCLDALARDESCGTHFRVEHQTEDGEARRDDERFAHVAAWEFTGIPGEPRLHKESLEFTAVEPTRRSYK